jgi:hypothetical protein
VTDLDRLHRYAADLILDHATDVEYITISEVAENPEHGFPNGVISDEDVKVVDDLIERATVRVSWPDHEYVYGNTFEDETDDEGSSSK